MSPARLRVDLELPSANSLSFRSTYAGVLGLANRIESLAATDSGRSVPIRALGPGEYQSELKFTRVTYEVNVTEPAQSAQMSHVSWLNKEHGLLMLGDLLPRAISKHPATVSLEVPVAWAVASNISDRGAQHVTANPENAVFLVGPLVRKKTQRMGPAEFSLITSGKWPFSDGDALKVGAKLVEEYSKTTGHSLRADSVMILVPFAGEAGPEKWTAETRGNATLLLLGNRANGKRVLQKLGIVLSHEIFHLWVPNALTLVGDYDWFFEGFTLYRALRTALQLKLISFDTFLETIARVYDSHASSLEVDRLSLVEASQRRWTTASALVYDKGMLTAFVYDLTIRSATDCRQSLDDVYRQLFRLHATGQGPANETIIKLLNETAMTSSFGSDYVENRGRINLQAVLAPYGLQLRTAVGAQPTRLEVAREATKVQRKALRCLGYRG